MDIYQQAEEKVLLQTNQSIGPVRLFSNQILESAFLLEFQLRILARPQSLIKQEIS